MSSRARAQTAECKVVERACLVRCSVSEGTTAAQELLLLLLQRKRTTGARQSLRGRRGNHTPPHRGASGCSGAVTSRCHASTRRVNMRGFIILHIHPLELQLPKVTSCGDRSTSNVVSPRLQTRHRVARGATTYLHTSLALAATHESRRQPPPTLTSEWHSWLLRFGDTLQSELVASVASSGADGREPSCGQPRGQWRRRH